MRLAIVGSRHYNDKTKFNTTVTSFIEEHGVPDVIISGGAQGADALAETYAREHSIPVEVYHADWSKYGKRAGPIRNSQIVKAATHVIAFPLSDSVGTYDTITKATKDGLYVMIIVV